MSYSLEYPVSPIEMIFFFLPHFFPISIFSHFFQLLAPKILMKNIVSHEQVDIFKDVRVKIAGRTVTVFGPRGALTKNFDHAKLNIFLVNKGKTLRTQVWGGNQASLAVARTIVTHIRNMMIGVTKGFLYKMKLVANHFPISVACEDGKLEIRNFLGEKRVRYVPIPTGVTFEKAKDSKDEIHFFGNNIDDVAQTCADVHQSTLVRHKDIRKFLDGIYVSTRTNITQDE
jgi:large subunit ribosomal protein L9e